MRGPGRAGRTYVGADLEAIRGDAVGRADGVGGGADRTAPGSKDMVPGRRRVGGVAAYNGAMGSPQHGRVLEASRPALRACNRQFYGEGRVLGSQTGLPRFKSPAGLRGPRMGRRVD